MNAKEMFEKLGYIKVESDKYKDTYWNPYRHEDITFWGLDKRIVFNVKNHVVNMDMYLHKAINQQIKELRWLDGK